MNYPITHREAYNQISEYVADHLKPSIDLDMYVLQTIEDLPEPNDDGEYHLEIRGRHSITGNPITYSIFSPEKLFQEFTSLIKAVQPTITDDDRADDESEEPGILVTFGTDENLQAWGYQTGDNSFTGGAYSYPLWGLAYVYRDSDPEDAAAEALEDILSQIY